MILRQVSRWQCIASAVTLSEEVSDETFATGVLGRRVGIQPSEDVIVAPFDGEVSTVADTKHAVGLSSPNGMELLIHIGVDTVAMNGDGFPPVPQSKSISERAIP